MPERMNDDAMAAAEWTRRQLTPDQHAFLTGLPLTAEDDDRLYVHASAASPAAWDYVLDERAAARSLMATDAAVTFCGHTHLPALFHMTARRPRSRPSIRTRVSRCRLRRSGAGLR